jgi:hypothetical protein
MGGMGTMPRVLLSLALFAACGAARAPSASEPHVPHAPSEATTTAAPEKRSPAAIALDAAEAAIRAQDWAKAETKLQEARRLAGDGAALRRVVYLEVALHAYRGDYEAAARVLVDHLAITETRRDDPTAFYEHNWLSIVRQAQGDLTAAIVEADARTRFGESATWSTPPGAPRGSDRETQVKLKETWHRAYLLRMHAEQVTGSAKKAALAYAAKALEEYTALARPLGAYEDSIAVLEAFFAMHDGDMQRAAAAASRVDVSKNDDVEDLYLVYSALDAAGDKKGAAAAKKRIDSVSYVSFVVPIVRTWIQRDGEPGPKRWSPRYPMGKP